MTAAELWATWLTAGGTILAAPVPGVLWFFERRDRKAAQAALRAREAQDAEAERTRQAREVFVWREGDRESDGNTHRDKVVMHNASQLPVFDVIVVGYSSGRLGLEPGTDMSEVVLPCDRFAGFSRGRQ